MNFKEALEEFEEAVAAQATIQEFSSSDEEHREAVNLVIKTRTKVLDLVASCKRSSGYNVQVPFTCMMVITIDSATDAKDALQQALKAHTNDFHTVFGSERLEHSQAEAIEHPE